MATLSAYIFDSGFNLSALYVVALVALVTVAYGSWWLWWRFPRLQANNLRYKVRDTKARADIEDSYRKTVTQLFGGIAVLGGTFVALNQLLGQQEQTRLQLKSSEDLLISNQISKAFELLGSDKIMPRIGGIYSLEYVAKDSERYRVEIYSALITFVKNRAPLVPDNTDVPGDVQAGLTVLARNLRDDSIQLNLDHLNFKRVIINNALWQKSDLEGTDLEYAAISRSDFSGSHMEDSNLSYSNMERANFSHCYCARAKFITATMLRSDLSHGDFSGADFSYANLAGSILDDADFADANIDAVQLLGACGKPRSLPNGLQIRPCRADEYLSIKP